MELYRIVCHKVEDVFIKMLTRKQNQQEIKQKVETFRNQKAIEKELKKKESKTRLA
ncbi:hypothetical protein ACFVSW_05280 [Neobacillus sp. NPDC058068]|uniref:hypothetical protein n=1 Tax=Neobacillus sp. NPDC058068 TaxID=3346325 RepID=UPI0036DD730A